MKVLIIHASAGAGHRRAAEAIYNYLKENSPDLELVLLDALDKTNALFKFDYTKGYSFLVHYATRIWHWAFLVTDSKFLRPVSRSIARIINCINSQRLIRYFIQENPDVIISTHFLPSELAAGLKKKHKLSSKLITVITDYGVHPFWISAGTDLYVVASDFTRDRLVLEGVSLERIRVLGLPFDPKFLRHFDRRVLCHKFGIDHKKFTVLLMTGSFGLGPLEEIIEVLHKDCQILAVCAGNERLYSRLIKRNLENVKVFGFVSNAEELMAASQVIITKPGGATITEVLIMELPAIFISAIPGQETANVEALAKYGIGASPKNIEELKKVVLDLKNNPEKILELKQKIRQVQKPFACKELASVIR
ncbi:MAG TPA: glycosyltransferase [Candidatus Omnitrophota bacterium]|nr:glycosyltransferase [Candidatus Omnitrophota bacterium]